MMRAFCFVLLGSLEALAGPAVWAQEAVAATDREGGFEFLTEASDAVVEDPQIFTPLSPVVVESESVRLPDDQAAD